jgi:uncharacterized membrane protein YfcA
VFYLSILAAGLGVGAVFGLFGAGGSAFATPVLALLGVPGLAAVASPLPAVLPSAVAGARRYLRSGQLDRRVAFLAVAGGVPGTVVGALASTALDGHWLLILSGAMLALVGGRVLWRDAVGHEARAAARRSNGRLVVAASFGVGLLTGLLANGGGFLLVPLFIVVLGLTSSEAAGTSMVAVGALTIPTLATHWALGHVDWPIALVFAVGAVPGSVVGSRLAQHIPTGRLRRAFGVVLVTFATWFLARQLL